MVKYLRHQFLRVDYDHQYKYSVQKQKKSYIYENIRSIDDYWDWFKNVFAVKYPETLRNVTAEKAAPSTAIYRTNTIVGWPTLRQLRVKNGKDF
jgi:hypothetical protein